MSVQTLFRMWGILIALIACWPSYVHAEFLNIHVSVNGSDSGSSPSLGSITEPVATMTKAISLIDAKSASGKIIVHGGTYKLTQAVEIKPPSGTDTSRTLSIEAAPGETPIFDGGRQVTLAPLANEPGIYLFEAKYSAGDSPQVWEESSKTRYLKVQSMALLRQTDYGIYPYAANVLAIRSKNGVLPKSGDLWVSDLDYGFLITRSNVTITGLSFKSFGQSYSAAAIMVGANNNKAMIDNINIKNCKFDNTYSAIYTIKGLLVNKVTIEDCIIRNVAGGINAHGGDVTINHCDIRNDQGDSNPFAFRFPSYYSGEGGIIVRDNYGTVGSSYTNNTIVGFRYGINLAVTSNTGSPQSGFGTYRIENNTIVLRPTDKVYGTSYGISFSRYVGADCTQCSAEKAIFANNIIDGFVYPYHINKSGSSAAALATINNNVFWHTQLNMSSFTGEVPLIAGTGKNVVEDPMFVNRIKDDYRIFPDSPAAATRRNAGALNSTIASSFTEPLSFRVDVPTITNKQKLSGSVYQIFTSVATFNVVSYATSRTRNTKIEIHSSTYNTTTTHPFQTEEILSLPDTLGIYDVIISLQDDKGQWSDVQHLAFERKSSSVFFTNSYQRSNPWGFVVFISNNQAYEQYISYRKKGSSVWIKGFDDSQYQTAYSQDLRLAGMHPMVVIGLEPNTIYEYMITPRQGASSAIYEIKTTDITSYVPNTYYVSPQGLDAFDRTGKNAPLKSLQFALDLSLPGDTIILLSGVHNGQAIMMAHSGTKEYPITIKGQPNGTAVLNGGRISSTVLELNAVSFVDVSLLSFQAVTTNGMVCYQCSNVNVSYNQFLNDVLGVNATNLKGTGLSVKNSSDVTIQYNLFRSWWWGMVVSKSPRTKVINNTVTATAETALDLGFGSTNSEISYNTFNFTGNSVMNLNLKDAEKLTTTIDYNNLGTLVRGVNEGVTNTNYPYLGASREFINTLDSSNKIKTFMSFQDWKLATGFDAHSIVADPLWVDPLKDNFYLKETSPNLALVNGKFLGAFGQDGVTTDGTGDGTTNGTNSEAGIIKTIYVDASAADVFGDGSLARPFKTIQKALDNATPGTKIIIRAGTYLETLNFKQSGTVDHPIIIEGERGINQKRLAVIDGSRVLTGWQPAPEIGDGVYKIANQSFELYPLLRLTPYAMTIEGKFINQFRDNPYMNSDAWKTYFTLPADALITADNPEHAAGNEAYLGKVKFWDVAKAMFKTTTDYTYLRIADKSNPNSLNIRAAYIVPGYSSMDKIRLLNLSYLTIRGLNLINSAFAVWIEGADAHHITIEDNYINSYVTGINLNLGPHDISIKNNEITFMRHGPQTGAWGGGSASLAGDARYEYDLKQAIYQWYHHWIFNGSAFIGINASSIGNNIDINSNTFSNGLMAIAINSSDTQTCNHLFIHHNKISNFSSGSVYLRGGLVDAQVNNNVFNNSNWHVRHHELNHLLFRKVYVYNNWFFNPDKIGQGMLFHWFSGKQHPAQSPEIYIYHNNFIGGNYGLNFDAYASEYGGLPGMVVANNIFSSSSSTLSNAGTPEKDFFGGFDYNWIDTVFSAYTTKNWYGVHNLLRPASNTQPFISLTADSGLALPADSPVREAGLDLSKPFKFNNKYYLPLPGMGGGYFTGKAPDIGACSIDASLAGDVSGDGRITVYDIVLLRRYFTDGKFTDTQKARADADKNGLINDDDVKRISKRSLGRK